MIYIYVHCLCHLNHIFSLNEYTFTFNLYQNNPVCKWKLWRYFFHLNQVTENSTNHPQWRRRHMDKKKAVLVVTFNDGSSWIWKVLRTFAVEKRLVICTFNYILSITLADNNIWWNNNNNNKNWWILLSCYMAEESRSRYFITCKQKQMTKKKKKIIFVYNLLLLYFFS